jgi:hypothetical protein
MEYSSIASAAFYLQLAEKFANQTKSYMIMTTLVVAQEHTISHYKFKDYENQLYI